MNAFGFRMPLWNRKRVDVIQLGGHRLEEKIKSTGIKWKR
jgi:hypothetical protein